MRHVCVCLLIALNALGCVLATVPRAPSAGIIQTDTGGLVGYQHGIERSRFVVGGKGRAVAEFGFLKVVGSTGTFAVDAVNGAAIAIPNARSAEQMKVVWYSQGAAKHNQEVRSYFVAAGLPENQIGAVHATTSLFASGGADEAATMRPTVAGWQSILEREADGIPIVDSVAWARMNEQGTVITEWVYWPAIPAKVILEAAQFRRTMLNDVERAAFLSRLPSNLLPGQIVIRHSSATADAPVEVFASYDVLEQRASQEVRSPAGIVSTASIVRHFDIDGNERYLSHERRGRDSNYPTKKKPYPSTSRRLIPR